MMIFRRILSNSSFKSSVFAGLSLRYHPFVASRLFHFHNNNNACHQIRRFYAAIPTFDFDAIRHPDDAVALFRDMLRSLLFWLSRNC